MSTFYALRYAPDVPFDQRKHEPTLGRWDDFGEADDERTRRFNGHLMEVVRRGVRRHLRPLPRSLRPRRPDRQHPPRLRPRRLRERR
jgi:hypothetical protein